MQKMSKRDGHKGFHHHHDPMSIKAPPIQSINNQNRIYAFLGERIRGQDTAIYGLSCTLSRLIQPHNERKVYKATLGGPSGTGKMTTIEAIRHLLGMDPGYAYANQFIALSGISVSDDKAKAGGKDGLSLLKRLKNAIQTPKSPLTGKKDTLPYLCLFIDGIEKASARFIDCVGPLFETGTYTIATGESFSIPKKTPLLVLFTTNCASAGIAKMSKYDDSVAAEMIRLNLKERWPDDNLMEKMEPIYPFYILKADTLRPILMVKFDEYVRDSDISNRFGKGMMEYTSQVKDMIVEHVLVKVNTAHGIQGSISQLIRKLDIFFCAGLGALDSYLSEIGADQQHLRSPIVVTTHSIDIIRFRESLDRQLDNAVKELKEQAVVGGGLSVSTVINSILKNPENEQIMAECDPKQEGTVNAVAMAYGNISLCSLVMNITYNNYQIINHHDQEEEVRELKRKLKRYKNDLKEVIHTIDRASSTEGSFHSTMKKIADAKRKLIESSVSSSDEEDNHPCYLPAPHVTYKSLKPIANKKRARPLRLSSETIQPLHKRVRLDENDTMLDLSDEIDLYLDGASEETELQQESEEEDENDSILSEILAESEEEEVIEQRKDWLYCKKCGKMKPKSVFIRKRKDCKTGVSISSVCASCRK